MIKILQSMIGIISIGFIALTVIIIEQRPDLTENIIFIFFMFVGALLLGIAHLDRKYK